MSAQGSSTHPQLQAAHCLPKSEVCSGLGCVGPLTQQANTCLWHTEGSHCSCSAFCHPTPACCMEISPLQWHLHPQRPSLVTLAGWGKHSLCFLHASIVLSSPVPLSHRSSPDKEARQPASNERDTSQGAFSEWSQLPKFLTVIRDLHEFRSLCESPGEGAGCWPCTQVSRSHWRWRDSVSMQPQPGCVSIHPKHLDVGSGQLWCALSL